MMRPIAQRLKLGGRPPDLFGPGIVARFLQPEAIKRQQDSVAWLCLGPVRQGPCRPGARQVKPSEMPIHLQGCHMSDQIEGIRHEMPVKDRHRGSAMTFDGM